MGHVIRSRHGSFSVCSLFFTIIIFSLVLVLVFQSDHFQMTRHQSEFITKLKCRQIAYLEHDSQKQASCTTCRLRLCATASMQQHMFNQFCTRVCNASCTLLRLQWICSVHSVAGTLHSGLGQIGSFIHLHTIDLRISTRIFAQHNNLLIRLGDNVLMR